MKWRTTIILCILLLITLNTSHADVLEPAEEQDIVSVELWMSVYGPMAESGAITTDIPETDLAGTDPDGLFLLYTLRFIRNSFYQTTTSFEDLTEQDWKALNTDIEQIKTLIATYTTQTTDLPVSTELTPIKVQTAVVINRLTDLSEAFAQMKNYSGFEGNPYENDAFMTDNAILLEKDDMYEESVRDALSTIATVDLNPYFSQWSRVIYGE